MLADGSNSQVQSCCRCLICLSSRSAYFLCQWLAGPMLLTGVTPQTKQVVQATQARTLLLLDNQRSTSLYKTLHVITSCADMTQPHHPSLVVHHAPHFEVQPMQAISSNRVNTTWSTCCCSMQSCACTPVSSLCSSLTAFLCLAGAAAPVHWARLHHACPVAADYPAEHKMKQVCQACENKLP